MAAGADVSVSDVLMFRDPEVQEALRRAHRRRDKGSDAFFGAVKEAVLAAVRAKESGCLVTVVAWDDEFGRYYNTGSEFGEWALAFVEQNGGMKAVRLSGPGGPLVESRMGVWRNGLDSESKLSLWFSW